MFKKLSLLTVVFLLVFTTMAMAQYNQAPEYDEQVEEGALPPVEERLPEDPHEVEVDSIGDYGGTLNSASTRPNSWGEDTMITDAANLVKADADGGGVRLELAKSIEPNEDSSVWTVELREGVKWSDGEPFTADDIIFWYEADLLNEDLTPVVAPAWKAEEEVVQVNKIDDYTVEFEFAGPKPYFKNRLVHQTPYYPSHYSSQFHPEYTDEEELEEMVEENDFDHWYELFGDKTGLWTASILGTIPATNTELPTLAPYVLVSNTSDRRIYERNPYYWKVDPEGNQLPYIERIETEIVSDREVLNGRIMSGEVDFAGFETDIRNFPMFKNYEDEGGYNTLTWTSGMSSDVIYMVNQTVEDENLREIFQDVRFRKALSLAIDRDEINESIYFGKGETTQYTALESTSYYEPEFAEAYTEFDPEKAAELLDEIGLEDQNGDGYRQLPNGDTFTFTIEFYPSETPKTPNVELVIEHWKDAGIDVNSKPVSGELQGQRAPANMMDATIWHGDKASDILFPVANNLIIPKAPGWDASQWVEWGRWVNTSGEEGEEPSPEVKQIAEWYQEMLIEPDEDKRIELGKNILESQAENLWVIGTVGKAPYVVIASDNLKNVPEDGLWCWDTLWSMSRNPSSFYFEGGEN